MLILAIRTDKPEAELYLYEDETKLAQETWPAHRELASTMHNKITALLTSQHKTLQDVEGLVCFRGPGSFTGLRIGLTVANTLAYALNIPILGTQDQAWLEHGIKKLKAGKNEHIILPHYGAPAHTTEPRK